MTCSDEIKKFVESWDEIAKTTPSFAQKLQNMKQTKESRARMVASMPSSVSSFMSASIENMKAWHSDIRHAVSAVQDALEGAFVPLCQLLGMLVNAAREDLQTVVSTFVPLVLAAYMSLLLPDAGVLGMPAQESARDLSPARPGV